MTKKEMAIKEELCELNAEAIKDFKKLFKNKKEKLKVQQEGRASSTLKPAKKKS